MRMLKKEGILHYSFKVKETLYNMRKNLPLLSY
jgi:hypothetical protein